jgi:hypothetical protein
MSIPSRRSALIVASSRYSDPRLRRLRAPACDAEQLAAVLGDADIGAFDVEVLVDEPEHVMRRKLAVFFKDRGRDDLLLLHFSCHGLKDEDGRLYFAATDTELDQLDATAVSAEFVNRLMNRSLSRRIVLLLDCCYAGAFGKGTTSRAGGGVDLMERFDGRGRVVLTASTSMEYAFEGDELSGAGNPSIFTTAVVDGLRTGAADADGDGNVSVDELYEHVYERVREATPNQTPSKWTFDVQGDLIIARSPLGPVAKTALAEPTEAPAEAGGASAVAMTRAARYRARALRLFRALGPLRVALIFAIAGLFLFLGPRGTGASTTLGDSPLNRLGTLTIGAGFVLAVSVAARRPLFSWAASFVAALALQEAVGAGATVFVEASRDGAFIPNRHRYLIGAAVAMALAAVAAAVTTRHNVGRQRHTRTMGVPLLVASIGPATAFMPLLSSPLTANANGSIEPLFYENPWYRLEPIGIAAASAFGALLVYRAAPRIAAGWLAGTAVNALLYVAGVAAFASSTFGDYGNVIRPSGLALFGTAALLAAASGLVHE